MKIEFTKMHGLGNDFIVIDNRDGVIELDEKQVQFLCDRHFGVGADGLILVGKSKKADCFMNYFNSDGKTVEMCGNGIRCTAAFFQKITNGKKNSILVDTRSGIRKIDMVDDQYAVDMGIPQFESKDFPKQTVALFGFNFCCVSFGNPHAVTYVDSLDDIDLKSIGPNMEQHPYFPNRINVEFAEIRSLRHIAVAVWERGCGITLACGTGACAAFAIGRKEKNLERTCTVSLPGGDLEISEMENGHIQMKGPAEFIFSASITL